MNTLQLICPHCNSTLSFGLEITPGTTVACLICAKPFRVPAFQAATVATPAPPLVLQPAVAAPAPPPVQEKPRAALPVSRPVPPPAPAEEGRAGQAVILVLLLCLVAGTGYVLWPRSESEPPTDSAVTDTKPVAAAEPESAPVAPRKTPAAAPPPPKKAPEVRVADSGTTDDDGPRTVVPKVVLQRKTSAEEVPSLPAVTAPTVREVPLSTAWGVEPARINAAIERGVRYLKAQQWEGGMFAVGYQALAGLTLLECGVAPEDPRLREAAAFVRSGVLKLDEAQHQTYQFALAILFLDRLGQNSDRRLIQGLTLRLLAGQSTGAGWTYQCPTLTPAEMAELYRFLHSHRPPHLQGQLLGADLDALPPPAHRPELQRDPANPFVQFGERVRALRLETPANPDRPKEAPKAKDPPKRLLAPMAPQSLPPRLQGLLPAQLVQARGRWTIEPIAGDDNSNSQFALLALWAARRHVVPVEDALQFAHLRYLASQIDTGGWDYSMAIQNARTMPTMTPVGLLGIAMGHGIAVEVKQGGERRKLSQEDPAIQKGLKALGQFIGTPVKGPADPPTERPSLYFLWSLERVAVLYDLKTIAGKDWYGWGAQILLASQDQDGSWNIGGYVSATPHLDTCLALLFLKRSNLVQDLTENLRMYMAIRDPGHQ